MARKKGSILSILGGITIIWVLPKALEALQSGLNTVDRILEIGNTLPYPWNVYAGSLALVCIRLAFDRFQSDLGE